MSARRKHKKKKKKKKKANRFACNRPEIHLKLSQSDRYAVIAGYFMVSKNRCPSDIYHLIDRFYDDTTYKYTISNEIFTSKFISALPGDELCSDTFDVIWNDMQFTFQLSVYPNGDEAKHCGSVDLMIECLTNIKQYGIKTLTFYLILYCTQTQNETRGLRIMRNDIRKWRWAQYSMKLSECHKYSVMEFKCFTELIQVEYEKNDAVRYMTTNDENVMISNICYKWKIHKTFASIWGEIYYSNNFNSNFWTLICIPQGQNYAERGEFKLRLRLLRMPFNVKSMQVNYTMNIKGFETYGISKTSHFALIHDEQLQCNNYHLEFHCNQSVILSKMNVWHASVTIQVMTLYDFNEKAIPPYKWREHNVLYQSETVRL